MKTLVYFSLLVLLVGVDGCKKEKQDACTSVVCLNGGTCVNGVCICDSNWTGANCQIALCQQNHTGSVHIICDTTFTYKVYVNGYGKGEVSYHNDLVVSNIPIVITSLDFVSTQQCAAYVSGNTVYVPCYYFTRNITINECQETTLIIP